ncbi:hypothetical protein GCM10009757_20520 [Streptomyces cheonanensis]|uniref:Uncharacterized protein n=1 Tax=Streptomyces cheonanensis TaxID=312720 RepID=A0ABN2V5Q8_9ACTN
MRRVPRSESTQAAPVGSSRSRAASPMAPAFSKNDRRSSCWEMPGTWSVNHSSTSVTRASLSTAAAMAAASAITGKRVRKLVKVTAAASRVQVRSSRYP